jgi:hypothetical protein
MTIAQKYKKWSNLDLRKVAMDTLMLDHEQDYIEMQRKQMYEGQNSLGGNMNSYKWDSYAEYKQGKNSLPPYGARDNYLEGNFYKGISIDQISAYVFEVVSVDEKNDIIEKQSGGDIWGLNKQFSDRLKPKFQESVIKRIKNATE